MATQALAAALLFAAIFLAGGAVCAASPRVALSIGAGASTAYVFVHMLPELSQASGVFVAATADRKLPAPELRVYVSALVGFLVFYGLENMVAWSHERAAEGGSPRGRHRPVVFLHIGGFAAYVWLVSYLMVRAVTDRPVPIGLYALAMGLHFLGVHYALRREHGAAYDRVGRFLLAGAALAGWASAMLIEVPKPIVITGLGLVSGGVVMNSMVMELPSEKDGRFWPFVLGAAGYAALLALIR